MESKNHKVLEKSMQILEHISHNPKGITLTKLCEDLHLPKSTAHGLLSTFTNLGYLQRNAGTGAFTLGLAIFELGNRFLENNDFYQYCGQILEQLVEQVGETSHIAILDGADVVYISKCDSPHAVRMMSQIGKRLPAHATAIGKALLSDLTDFEVRSLYADTPLEPITENTVTDIETLLLQLQDIRRQGYAKEREESTPGICCIAIPVTNHLGRVTVAISIAAPLNRVSGNLETFLPYLEEARDKLQPILH